MCGHLFVCKCQARAGLWEEGELMGQQTDMELEQRALDARGRAVTFDVCASAFLNEPSEQVLADVALVGQALGAEFEGLSGEMSAEELAELRRCFNDVLFVAVSPRFVPLQESCLVGSGLGSDGKMHYGSVQSSRSDHVQRCYKAAGFDMTAVPACPVVKGTLRCDSLACELAFLAYLANGEFLAWQKGATEEALHWNRLANEFAHDHARVWFATARDRMQTVGAAFYAHVCDLAIRALEVPQE